MSQRLEQRLRDAARTANEPNATLMLEAADALVLAVEALTRCLKFTNQEGPRNARLLQDLTNIQPPYPKEKE